MLKVARQVSEELVQGKPRAMTGIAADVPQPEERLLVHAVGDDRAQPVGRPARCPFAEDRLEQLLVLLEPADQLVACEVDEVVVALVGDQLLEQRAGEL